MIKGFHNKKDLDLIRYYRLLADNLQASLDEALKENDRLREKLSKQSREARRAQKRWLGAMNDKLDLESRIKHLVEQYANEAGEKTPND